MHASKGKIPRPLMTNLPLHGGDLSVATGYFKVPIDEWVDLSTGMNTQPYPIQSIPDKVFYDLPYMCCDFITAAQRYYGYEHLLALPGSQSAIHILPQLLSEESHLPVLLPDVGYQEHNIRWTAQGVNVDYYKAIEHDEMCADVTKRIRSNPKQHVVVIQPNNPTTVLVSCEQLLLWSSMLDASAYLIIDEAFIDTTPLKSILRLEVLPNNVIVLRSFGKFFGLAGIRVGFVFAHPLLLERISLHVGLWSVSGPAQYVATQALNDSLWQSKAIEQAHYNTEFTRQIFDKLMAHFHVDPASLNALFISYRMPMMSAYSLYCMLASLGILTRVIQLPSNLALLRVACINRQDSRTLNKVYSAIEKLSNYKIPPQWGTTLVQDVR